MAHDQYREKWQQRWAHSTVFTADNFSNKPPYYVLDMFPYPSGNSLHVGHAVGYVGTDIVARKKRMEGFNVLHPMGWDAFGLPAEQYAIKTGVHPAAVTRKNCDNFKRQLMLMGLSYDWSRELDTSDKKYYRWTQLLFLKLYERGLVYEKEESVWWCEALKTVLANEEVIDGRSERGDYPCIKKPLKQWMVRITAYADRLLEGLDALDWPESVKKMQREWIGRTEDFEIESALNVGVNSSQVRYRMRDWLFSQQRYWGEPFPLYRDASGGIVAAQESELPIELPMVDGFAPSADGSSPLQRAHDWVNCTNATGEPLYRVTDTMPGWAGSCWYFLRFMDPHNDSEPFSTASMEYWQQVDLYVGGAAHATMHLLYARFWHKVLFDVGLVNFDEPFKRLYNQGLVTADAFKDGTGRIVAVDEAQYREGKYWLRNSDHELQVFNTKMSKSLLNVVVPDDIIREYGVDTFRIYMMFMGPLGQNKKWDVKGIKGCERFLDRVLALFDAVSGSIGGADRNSPGPLDTLWSKTLTKVNASFVTMNFNTAIAAFMEFINQAESHKMHFIERIGADFLKALFPFAPHICSELWERLGNGDIDHAPWPQVRVAAIPPTRIFVNGKYVDELPDPTGDESMDVNLARSRVMAVLTEREVIKVIYTPNKAINFLCV